MSQTPTNVVWLPFVQPLKPHQVDDATTNVSRGLGGYHHTFLSNDMGMGKTKTYFTAIELKNRHKRKSRQQDIDTKGQSGVKSPSGCQKIGCWEHKRRNV
ncbi:unnamed protein product [Fusarium equiseti]|uniref:SNF2 N-terminal domain-containing protein n=1 Tax=Fusarium equiseti TaxID=61235 RepID=A0A8J2IY85_FUSEQ|nr:unnamed protein product [Fusarium equiseti]